MPRLALPLSLLLACAAEATPPKPVEAVAAEVVVEAPKVEKVEKVEAPAPDPKEACARIVVVAWAGAEGAEPTVTRDEASAKMLAEELRERLIGGIDIGALATQSDEPKTRAKNGAMGTFERAQWPEKYAEIAESVFAARVGETTPAIRTPLGFVVAQRCAVEKVHARHILVRYKGAKNADKKIKRDAVAARTLAEKIREEAATPAVDFAGLAKKYSEDGSAASGGDLGSVGRGMFAPAFEAAAFKLARGEMSPVVETDFGFHVIQRVD